jgi:hypothetical protein
VCLSQAHAGAPAARNLGLVHSHGEFIQFLDSDDVLGETKIGRQTAILREHGDAPYCYCVTRHVDAEGRTRELSGTAPGKDRALNAVRPGCTSLAPLWRRRVLCDVGPWDEDLACRQDWVYRVRAVCRHGAGVFVAEPLCEHRLHPGTRISAHGTLEFARGVCTAVARAADTVRAMPSPSAAALDCLSRELAAAARTFVRLGDGVAARRALGAAWDMAGGSQRLRLGVLRVMLALLGTAGTRAVADACRPRPGRRGRARA